MITALPLASVLDSLSDVSSLILVAITFAILFALIEGFDRV